MLVPLTDPLWSSLEFRSLLPGGIAPKPTLLYGELLKHPGFHAVETETEHWTENLAGLGGSGAQLFVGLISEQPMQSHPMLPVIQVIEANKSRTLPADEIDVVLPAEPNEAYAILCEHIVSVAARETVPQAMAHGTTDFQLTRGYLGVTT